MNQKAIQYIYKALMCCCVCLFISGEAVAQDPHFSQFYANPLYLNPAFAGSAVCPRLSLAYRNQWPGIPGAYSTVSAAYDQHIDALAGGLGIIVTNDRQGGGSYMNTHVGLMYSFRARLGNSFFLKLGAQATYVNRFVNWNDLKFPDQYDPMLGFVRPSTNENLEATPMSKNYVDFSAGLLAYNDYFYVGFSAAHLGRPDEGVMGIQRLPMRFSGQIGGKIYFKQTYGQRRNEKDFNISPNLIYVQQGSIEELNYGCYANIHPMVFGLWFRHSFSNVDALVGMIGFHHKGMRIGYSYDVTLSRIKAGGGAHEITFAMQFACKKRLKDKKIRPIPCPSF